MQAYDAAGNHSAWSPIVSARPLSSPPPLPDSGVGPEVSADLPPIIIPDALPNTDLPPVIPDAFVVPDAGTDLPPATIPDSRVLLAETAPEAPLVIGDPDAGRPEVNLDTTSDLQIFIDPDSGIIDLPDAPSAVPDAVVVVRPEVQPFGPETGTDSLIVATPDSGVDARPEAPVLLVDAFFMPETGLLAEAGLLAPDAGALIPEAGQLMTSDAGAFLPEAGQLIMPDGGNEIEVRPADADNPSPVQKSAGCGCSLGGHSRYVENSSRPQLFGYLLRILN